MNEPTLYYFKKLEKELFFEDLETLYENDGIEYDEYNSMKHFALNNNYEYIYIEIDDLDTLHALNKLELESFNFEAILEDYNIPIQPNIFEDILLKLFIQGKLSFWIPSNDMKDFSSDVINITSKFELEDNIKYNNYSVEFKQILSTLSDLLDQKCFDTGYTQINVKESILNYDDYTIKI
ncbi:MULTISPECIES: hypothetical protein [unclassified Vibrio]|uniref:hypothetical protein n=1 Tax=unclassified Vibrio TaxID=2614977 RepID=UPI000C834D30|nr:MULTISPECIES: hypothetical protein [unclassified Vibrio]PMK74889.1 hypothetical protein BCT92_23885 [Vibrio sp. 10N.261.52.E5]TKF76169.1 hypothetical protein FCV65_24735 [Vibrio sp. F13]